MINLLKSQPCSETTLAIVAISALILAMAAGFMFGALTSEAAMVCDVWAIEPGNAVQEGC